MQPDQSSGTRTDLRDGFSDQLQPTVPLDLASVESFSDLVEAMSRTAFGGRNLGEAADVLHDMVADPDCFVVGTFSGAMTVAKMGLVLADMIEHRMLDAVVSTGALMAHGFVEASGRTHFKYDPAMDDRELYYRGYNRVYDTLELEQNLDDIFHILVGVLETVDPTQTLCSREINRLMAVTCWSRGRDGAFCKAPASTSAGVRAGLQRFRAGVGFRVLQPPAARRRQAGVQLRPVSGRG